MYIFNFDRFSAKNKHLMVRECVRNSFRKRFHLLFIVLCVIDNFQFFLFFIWQKSENKQNTICHKMIDI